MFLHRIILHDFKNIPEAEVEFSPKVNCIHGSNGAGKTNLLDAIYYLSMTKSYFSSSDQYVYAHGADETTLCGFYRMDGGTEEKIAASVRRGGEKIFKRGAKTYGRFSEHIGLLPIVMVSPLDAGLINDSGEERRKYLNFILSQIDREYLSHIQAYNQLLLQRNRLLKDDRPQELLLETFSERMAPHAAYVHQARRDLCDRLRPLIREFYRRLSQGREDADLAYRSDLDDTTLEALFAREAEKERVLRYTTAGIQRDDLLFRLDGHPLRRCGSHGAAEKLPAGDETRAVPFCERDIRTDSYPAARRCLRQTRHAARGRPAGSGIHARFRPDLPDRQQQGPARPRVAAHGCAVPELPRG